MTKDSLTYSTSSTDSIKCSFVYPVYIIVEEHGYYIKELTYNNKLNYGKWSYRYIHYANFSLTSDKKYARKFNTENEAKEFLDKLPINKY